MATSTMTKLPEQLVISSGDKGIKINYAESKKAAYAFRAINHGLRASILRLLDEQKRLGVTEIYHRLNLEQSVASQHLAILRRAGIVKTEREGKTINYSINKPRLTQMERIIKEMI